MSCSTGKLAYGSKELAETAIVFAQCQHFVKKRDTLPVRSYYCKECGRYHITSYPLLKEDADVSS